jgi:hydrogenase maturation protease
MNRPLVDRIANAVLYEGYILYPYRPSVKNQQRWTFGGLYPEAYCRAQPGNDSSSSQTECLVEGGPETTIDVTVRFLHLIERVVGELVTLMADWPNDAEPVFRPVEVLQIGDQVFHSWQEAEERSLDLSGFDGVLVRRQEPIEGTIEAEAAVVADGLFKLTLRIANGTRLDDSRCPKRDDVLLRTLVSTHAILGVQGGAFVSLLDPPELWREGAAGCRNIGTWPVLVGEVGDRDTLLSSPIILYDYPEVAAESPGDLFDATEIDEILTLRILTLTEEEKRSAAALDKRTRDLLARTESLAREQLAGLHGTMRNMRPL